MTVSNIVRLGTGNLTPQQLADMALEADQARRRAEARDNQLAGYAAGQYAAERDQLCSLSIAKVLS